MAAWKRTVAKIDDVKFYAAYDDRRVQRVDKSVGVDRPQVRKQEVVSTEREALRREKEEEELLNSFNWWRRRSRTHLKSYRDPESDNANQNWRMTEDSCRSSRMERSDEWPKSATDRKPLRCKYKDLKRVPHVWFFCIHRLSSNTI